MILHPEQRSSDRIQLAQLKVRERNGDFEYHFQCANLNETHLFLAKRFNLNNQSQYSELQFTLPNGQLIFISKARIIREELRANQKGSVFEFLGLRENTRLQIFGFFQQYLMKGTA
jgi:hypothetical protein